MKHLKLYEKYTKPYYYFDLVEFYNNFRNTFHKEKNIKDKNDESYSDGIFSILDNILSNWKNNVLAITIEEVIKKILIDKEVEFSSINRIEEIGRVKYVRFYPKIYSIIKDNFYFNIQFYSGLTDIDVDYTKPFKIYGTPSKIEKYLEMISDTNKYNL